MAYPGVTARIKCAPLISYFQPDAKPAGTVDTRDVSRKGHASRPVCRSAQATPFAKAASIGPQTILDATTVVNFFSTRKLRANSNAARPGGSPEPNNCG